MLAPATPAANMNLRDPVSSYLFEAADLVRFRLGFDSDLVSILIWIDSDSDLDRFQFRFR